jgi:hypothetical protein
MSDNVYKFRDYLSLEKTIVVRKVVKTGQRRLTRQQYCTRTEMH